MLGMLQAVSGMECDGGAILRRIIELGNEWNEFYEGVCEFSMKLEIILTSVFCS